MGGGRRRDEPTFVVIPILLSLIVDHRPNEPELVLQVLVQDPRSRLLLIRRTGAASAASAAAAPTGREAEAEGGEGEEGAGEAEERDEDRGAEREE